MTGMGQSFAFQATGGNVWYSNKQTFAIVPTKSRVSPTAALPWTRSDPSGPLYPYDLATKP
jgi:hypothetical protein